MTRLFLDIETLPCDDDIKEKVIAILQKKERNKDKDPEQLFLETGFDGTFGRICCIAYIKDNGSILDKGVLRGNEQEILQQFWQVSRDVHVFVGHNVLEFDLPFIYQRSMVLNVRPSQNLNFAKYRNNPIYDTMKEWTKWAYNAGPKLDTLAHVLQLPTSKDAMDGSEVWTYYQAGKIDEICAYCMKDVVLTRQVFYKMNFEKASDIPGIEEFTKVKESEGTEGTKERDDRNETKGANGTEESMDAKIANATQASLLEEDEIPF